jgi:hypothetical protein
VSGSVLTRARQRERLANAARWAVLRHARWLQLYGPTSYDPYDFWALDAARRAKAVYYRRGRLGLPLVAPFVFLDAALPRSRAVFWHRARFATSDAHYAMGFCVLAAREGRHWLERALPFLDALKTERCPGEEEYCWGYPFHWETCFGTWPAGTPLITCTPYGYEAFEAYHALTGSAECLRIMESVGRFAFARIGGVTIRPGVKASTYSTIDRRRVVNASAYRSLLLAAAGVRFGHEDWIEEARATMAFVVASQRDDGSWFYAMDGKDEFIDNFHTCFVLKSLVKARPLLGDESLTPVIERGYAFYKKALLDSEGLPIPFAREQRLTLQRRDLYDYAEGINLALLLSGEDPDAPAIADRLVRDLLERWTLPDGHLVTRFTLFGRNTVPYHRWAQAQAFRSLALYAALVGEQEDSSRQAAIPS